MGTTNALDKRIVPVGVGNLESVSIVEANDRTRVVLNLGAMTGYQTEVDGDRLLVTLDADAEGTVDFGEEVAEVFDDTEILMPASGEELLANNELPIAETVPVESAVELTEIVEDDGLVVELPSSLPLDYSGSEEQTSQDSQVLPIDNFTVETGAPIEEYVDDIQTAPPSPRLDDVSFQPNNRDYSRQTTRAVPPAYSPNQPNYNGEELSLNFQDIEIRSVLQLLADFTDMNIVVSDNVDGTLTLRLKNLSLIHISEPTRPY